MPSKSVDARERAPIGTVDPPPFTPDLDKQNHRSYPSRIDGCIRQEQPRILKGKPVLKANVARNAERQAGRREKRELDDGHVGFGERLDGKISLCWGESRGDGSICQKRRNLKKGIVGWRKKTRQAQSGE